MKHVYLTFDFEECDVPCECGIDFPLADAIRVSVEGANALLDLLAREGVRATCFCTLTLAEHAPELMRRLLAEGHEIAAHSIDHLHPRPDDPIQSKQGLERLLGVEIAGYRQPRMMPTDAATLARAGFRYDSSLNPTFIPGRYCRLWSPRTPFPDDGILQIPASVTPHLRLPLFWLALHLLPERLYAALVRQTLVHDGQFVTYFHPWEFSPTLAARATELKVPLPIRQNLGHPMLGRLERLIRLLKDEGATFGTLRECAGCEIASAAVRRG